MIRNIYHIYRYIIYLKYIYIYTCNLFVLCYWTSTLQNKALSNKGHLGSRYLNKLISNYPKMRTTTKKKHGKNHGSTGPSGDLVPSGAMWAGHVFPWLFWDNTKSMAFQLEQKNREKTCNLYKPSGKNCERKQKWL